ncbi:hypothetical protein [Microbacterium sp.]|uniref:hypothetical protein n=1 Tax=Microbacterium sp. TaxID=51671 RepID=UPI003A8E93C1
MAEQHRRGRSERAVTVKPDGDGMAVLTAILPELLAYATHDRITSMADEVTRARPEGQRRPRRSTLAKIRAEREAALGMQTPHDPEPPAHPGAAFLDALDDPAPWEDDSVSCDEREAEAAEQMAEREHAAHAAAESFNLAPSSMSRTSSMNQISSAKRAPSTSCVRTSSLICC